MLFHMWIVGYRQVFHFLIRTHRVGITARSRKEIRWKDDLYVRITGWVDYKRSLEGERDVVTKMAETLAKRGRMIIKFGLKEMSHLGISG